MSISLIAVFIPHPADGRHRRALFREFAVALSVAIVVSLVVSLTTTPMMCARLLKSHHGMKHGRLYSWQRSGLQLDRRLLCTGLRWVLRHPAIMLVVLACDHLPERLSVHR